jgi:hypothetical protein
MPRPVAMISTSVTSPTISKSIELNGRRYLPENRRLCTDVDAFELPLHDFDHLLRESAGEMRIVAVGQAVTASVTRQGSLSRLRS